MFFTKKNRFYRDPKTQYFLHKKGQQVNKKCLVTEQRPTERLEQRIGKKPTRKNLKRKQQPKAILIYYFLAPPPSSQGLGWSLSHP